MDYMLSLSELNHLREAVDGVDAADMDAGSVYLLRLLIPIVPPMVGGMLMELVGDGDMSLHTTDSQI